MPPLPPVQAVRVAVEGTYANTKWAHVMHVGYAGAPPTSGNLATFLAAWDTAWAARFLPQQNSLVVHNFTTAVDLSSSLGASWATTPSNAGGLGGTPLPSQVALGVSWVIQRRYRGGHPRTYFPGVEEGWLATGTINFVSAAKQTAWGAAAASFRADVSAAGGLTTPILGSVSYFSANARRVTPIFDPFITEEVHPRLDTQRRRLGKEV